METMDEFYEFCLSKGAKEVYYNIQSKPKKKWAVSDGGLFSVGYANCNGVALLNGEMCGLTHFDDTTDYLTAHSGQPKDYLPKVIKKAGGELEAFLLAGDKGHQTKIKVVLDMNNIPVIGEFCDGWSNNIPGVDDGYDKYIGQKGLLVLPKPRAIYIFSNVQHIGFRRLL